MSNIIEILKIEQNELIICLSLLYESEIPTQYSDRMAILSEFHREIRLNLLQNKLQEFGLSNGSDYILISNCLNEYVMHPFFGPRRLMDPVVHGGHECFDFLRKTNYALIKVTGPSNILKVLYSIPVEQLEKNPSYRTKYCAARSAYASQLSSDCCDPSVYKFLRRVDTELMLELQTQLCSVHQLFSRLPSTTVAQLISDFNYINQLESDEVLKPSKRELAMASLHEAIIAEKKSPTIIASYVLFKGESVLNPHYTKIFDMFLIKFKFPYEPNKFMAIYINMKTNSASQQPTASPSHPTSA